MFQKIFSMVLCLSLISLTVLAHDVATEPQTVLTESSIIKALNGVFISEDKELGLGISTLTPKQLNMLSRLSHSQNRCAGFEVLTADEASNPHQLLSNFKADQLKMFYLSPMNTSTKVVYNDSYKKIIDQANPNQLKQTIAWLSSYPNRYNKSATPNKHVEDLKVKLNAWLAGAPWKFSIETIAHTSTKQNSLKLTITGSKRPNEVVVLGGHLDSINQGLFGFPIPGQDKAPGADDNASGSSNLIEALKLLKQVPSFDRTLEFYWYAGEESGLLGSAEIAKSAKAKNKNVIGVLQLDMTLFPGDGEQVVSLMTDFTSPWLRSVMTEINNVYVKSRFIDSQCGYGCSDHASWNRQGYHAVIPHEATMQNGNKKIHTVNDVIDSRSSLTHSNTFTKYAVLFALVLGNSDIKGP